MKEYSKTKYIITCLLAILVFAPLYALIPINTYKKISDLKVPVRKLIEKTFVAIDKYDHVELGELESNVHIFTFNSRGELVDMRDIDKDGNLVAWYVTEYDKNNKKVLEKKYDKDNNLAGYSTFVYTKKGQIKQEDAFSPTGEFLYSFIFEYDRDDNMVLRKRIGADKEDGISTVYEYNAGRNLAGEKLFNKTGNIINSKQFSYNSKGLLLEDKRLDKDGAVRMVITYAYDENGNKTQITTSQKNSSSTVVNIRYEFDTKGNWIKQIIFHNEVIPVRVITREIIY
jgi:hypothetical protein